MRPRTTNSSTQTFDVHRVSFESVGALAFVNEYSAVSPMTPNVRFAARAVIDRTPMNWRYRPGADLRPRHPICPEAVVRAVSLPTRLLARRGRQGRFNVERDKDREGGKSTYPRWRHLLVQIH